MRGRSWGRQVVAGSEGSHSAHGFQVHLCGGAPIFERCAHTKNHFWVFGAKVQVPRRIPSTPFYRNFETYPTSSDLAEKVQRQAAYDLRKSLRVRGVFGTLSAFNFFWPSRL